MRRDVKAKNGDIKRPDSVETGYSENSITISRVTSQNSVASQFRTRYSTIQFSDISAAYSLTITEKYEVT
jgi:hypothetical protein